MSVIRLGGSQRLTVDHTADGKGAWIQALGSALDQLEQQAGCQGAQVDWSSIELETETDFIDERTMGGEGRELRLTSLRTTALAVTT